MPLAANASNFAEGHQLGNIFLLFQEIIPSYSKGRDLHSVVI